MSTLTIYRSGQIRLPLHDRKRDFMSRAFEQARKACRQFFDRVDIYRPRNQIKHLPLRAPTPEMVSMRREITRNNKLRDIVSLLLKNKWERTRYHLYLNRSVKPEFIGYRFPRERFLSGLLWASLALVTVSTVASGFAPSSARRCCRP